MAAGARFLPGPVHFSRPQPPPAGSLHFRGLSLVTWPSGGRQRTGLVATGIGGPGGSVAAAPPGERWRRNRLSLAAACSLDGSSDGTSGKDSGGGGKKGGGPGGGSFRSSSYAVPMGRTASGITRPLGEILRDLNKRVPSNIVDPDDRSIPWYHANRRLSFYAPGWCGEVRNVIFQGDGSVTVVYRVTIRGSDGEIFKSKILADRFENMILKTLHYYSTAQLKPLQAHRESTGTVSSSVGQGEDPVEAAEEIAFCRACARFGLGLYLYDNDKDI